MTDDIEAHQRVHAVDGVAGSDTLAVMGDNKPRGRRRRVVKDARSNLTGISADHRRLSFHAAPPASVERAPTGQAALDAIKDEMEQLQASLDALRSHVASREESAGASHAAASAFADELQQLLEGEPPDPDLVRRAVRLAAAEQAWERRLGTLLETRDVVDLLDVSRQRVSAMAKERRLIALPQEGRLRFPAWQFAGTDARDRACLAAVHRQLVEAGGISPWSAASWFQAPHPELEGLDPLDWLREKRDCTQIALAAQRDAARTAR